MEIFINELSLEGQYFTQNQFEEAVTKFSEMFAVIKKDVQVFKEDTLIYAPTIRDEIFTASFEKIADRSLKIAFRNIVFNKINPKNWKEERVHSEEDAYFYFDEDEDIDVTGKTLAEIAERNLQTQDTKRLALNFMESRYDSPLTICKNTKENKISVDYADDKAALVDWLGEIETPVTNFLRNTERFTPTSRIAPKVKTKIYKEIATSYYWYFDNFHANEFEVCDKTGKHIGVADLEGNIDPDKAVNRRSISDVL